MSSLIKYKLNSALPADTNARTLVNSVRSDQRYYLQQLFIVNITGVASTYSIFVGPEANLSTGNALAYECPIGANTVVLFDLDIYLNKNEALGIQSGTASAICFSLFGQAEQDKGGPFVS